MNVGEISYRSFMFRLWLVMQNGETSWRASLEDPHTGQQCFFSCPEEFCEFLQQLKQDLENDIRTGKQEIACTENFSGG